MKSFLQLANDREYLPEEGLKVGLHATRDANYTK